jgi:hypothetical protein
MSARTLLSQWCQLVAKLRDRPQHATRDHTRGTSAGDLHQRRHAACCPLGAACRRQALEKAMRMDVFANSTEHEEYRPS